MTTTSSSTSSPQSQGVQPKKKYQKQPKHDDYIQALTELGYSFRMNILDDTIEVNCERITDTTAAIIRDQMRDKGFYRHLTAVEDAYIHEAAKNPYHPVRYYLSGLNYDGGNYIAQLSNYFKDKHGIFHTLLRRCLIGGVAKAYTGAQGPMLVMEGAQNIGKSYLVRWLCPIPGMFLDAPINPDNKDDWINLITKWIWEVGELGATTRRADREALKGFISREVVTVRKPYGKHPIAKPALATLIGTFNNDTGILSDPTGNRRFNLCSLTEIDWNYATDVDKNMVWAEAQAAYLASEDWRLSPNEVKRQTEVNEEFEIEDPVENLLREYFDLTGNQTDWIATATIMKLLQDAGFTGNLKANQMHLSSAMKKMGLERYRFNLVWGYKGIKIRV